jgi:Homocysteine S-methyltransferase
LEANTGSLSFEYLDASLCSVRYFTMSLESGTRRTAARVFGGAYSQPCPLLADVQLACVEVDVGPLQPEQLAEHVRGYVERGARIVGGCCGSTPAHVAAVARALGR